MKHLSILLGLVLLSGAAVASAAIKGSKSNGSERVVCRDLACCKANPNAMASNGQPCGAILKMNSGHASEKKQLRLKGRVLSQQGRTFTVEVVQMKTGDYWTIPARRMTATFYGTKSGNGVVMPNVGTTVEITYVQTPDGQLETITFGREKTAERTGATATPTPSEQKGRGLGIAAHKEGQPATPAITPTPKPVNAVKFGRDKLKGITKAVPTPTPTPSKK